MTKELIERLREYDLDSDAWEAADMIEQQQKRIAELEADTEEVNAARIYLREQERLLRQLAAAQAQIKVLRDALENVEGALDESGMYQHYPVTYDLFIEALDTPTDDSALREMLAKERERCAKVCEEKADRLIDDSAACRGCAAAIRAIGSESPKLICPRCGVDRFKDKCPGPLHLCPIRGEAQ